MAITIKDVAREAGVSISTVSKVINHSPEISEATVTRVKDIMNQMNFTPNVRAANFKRRSTHNIAYLAALEKGEAFSNPHLFEILCGAHQELARKGYCVSLLNVAGEETPGKTIQSLISAGGYDGMIIHGSALTRSAAITLTHNNFPYIIVGKPEFESQVNWLDTNNTLAGDFAARQLLNGGAKRIGFIGGRMDEHISQERLDGAKIAASEFNIKIEDENIRYTDSSIEKGQRAATELLKEKRQIDSLICENNAIAIGALKAINMAGLSMPDDIQVITFDDYPYSQIMDPSPTVVNIDVFDLGVQAAMQLLKNIRNPAIHIHGYITLPEVIVRSTTKQIE